MYPGSSSFLAQPRARQGLLSSRDRIRRLAGPTTLIFVMLLGWGGLTTAHAEEAGAVYTSTNDPAGNRVLAFRRAADGTLTPAGSFSTGGTGTGAVLGSQGALVLTEDHRVLYVVNAGSNDISSFAIRPDGLTLLGRVPSGGVRPTSLTVARDLLYVLNAGGTGNITGFTGARHGDLAPLAGSTRPLSGDATNPAQVQFTPDGRVLLVTERATNVIDTYRVGADGRPTGPIVHASAGRTPFGFAVDHRGRAFVSEATDSSLSSYDIDRAGELTTLSAAVANGQAAACWAVVTENGRFVYTANAANGTISGYRVASDGTVRLLTPDGRTGVTGANPTDMALSSGSRYLYVLTNAAQAIRAFRVGPNGRLIPATGATGLASGMVGLAAR
jgi:6-phosphogluconolactonase (cycloisomerase 2 family)